MRADSLDSFNRKTRLEALANIAREITVPPAGPAVINHASSVINMHIHSFYSYNANDYSPAHIAVECRKGNFYAAGLCDFDVLDGLEEFFAAGHMLGLRVAVHIETRAYLKEYASMDINSLGEPGVTYIMGAGFGRLPDKNPAATKTLNDFRQQANLRNRALVERINSRLPEIAIDYNSDVLPLSPGGCPTERHIIQAYQLRARNVFPDREKLTAFWAKLLCKSNEEMERLFNDLPAMDDKVRSLLVKSGGIGYIRPTEKTFPPADDFITWVLECDAIPMAAWLDGTTGCEEDITGLLECLKAKGVAAINLIPDRNHNIKDPADRRLKLEKLDEMILTARKFAFPLNIGTEMNKNGQPFFDDLRCEALTAYREDFLRGANIMVGQGILSRYAGFSYCGKSAQSEFGADTIRKNNFFEMVGKLPPLSVKDASRLEEMVPEKAFQCIRDSAPKGKWR